MVDQAIKLAKAVGYYSGTVEFVVDKAKNFFFRDEYSTSSWAPRYGVNNRNRFSWASIKAVWRKIRNSEMIKFTECNWMEFCGDSSKTFYVNWQWPGYVEPKQNIGMTLVCWGSG